MKVFFTILVCKILRFIGKLAGKGSSLPGQIALKLCPDILSRVKLPEYIIAVTGSNGKTSTVEMIAHILMNNGKKVAWNKEGSNQIEGVTTLVLNSATLTGKVKSDILLIESDERFAKYTFKYILPTHYVITNLYRDQLTRNGHPEWVYNAIKDSIHDGTQLILNADDPLVSCFGWGKKDVIWFGADKLSSDTDELVSVYNDGAYCPVCKAPMEYSTHHYNHIGHYSCTKCGYKRQDTKYTITSVDLDKGVMEIDGKYEISLALKSLYNIYNILSAYTVASIVGISGEKIAADMNNYVLKNGRVITFKLGSREGTMLTSKHENSISYDQTEILLNILRLEDKRVRNRLARLEHRVPQFPVKPTGARFEANNEIATRPALPLDELAERTCDREPLPKSLVLDRHLPILRQVEVAHFLCVV